MNPVQTEILYKKAIDMAGLTGKEKIIDAYCGTGTIGLIASKDAKEVISVELNRDAVKDAIGNAKLNKINNVRFYQADAALTILPDWMNESERSSALMFMTFLSYRVRVTAELFTENISTGVRTLIQR